MSWWENTVKTAKAEWQAAKRNYKDAKAKVKELQQRASQQGSTESAEPLQPSLAPQASQPDTQVQPSATSQLAVAAVHAQAAASAVWHAAKQEYKQLKRRAKSTSGSSPPSHYELQPSASPQGSDQPSQSASTPSCQLAEPPADAHDGEHEDEACTWWGRVSGEAKNSRLRVFFVAWHTADFFGRFTVPKSTDKWTERVKANAYYYRCNYVVLCLGSYLLFFLHNPLAMLGTLLVLLAVLSTNDSFATTLNDKLLWLIRRIHPPTALKIRAKTVHPPSPLGRSEMRRRATTKVFILSVPRYMFVMACLAVAAVLLRLSAAWHTLALGTLCGIGLPLLHASFRSHNLKVKLANAKDDFKSHWKTYQADMMAAGLFPGPTDYTR